MIYYAVDTSRLHLYLVRLSLQSLRRWNSDIEVKVFCYGDVPAASRRGFLKLGAEVVSMRKPKAIPATFLKWHALRGMENSRVLYVDSDTLFFGDPLKLFRKFKTRDFYAREEYGTRPGVGFQLLGNSVLEPQIYDKKLKAISLILGFKRRPIFNTGVMLFNNGFAGKMGKRFDEMTEVFRTFVEHPGYYPAENPHLMDEVVSSIVFGRLPRFSYERISKKVSPWYCEWKAGVVSSPGIVMHSWSKYSPYFVREFVGAREAAKLPFLIPVENGYVEY